MKMRRHRVFLLCTVGLCVISFLHYYKALHYVSLLRELSAPYPNIKSFIMVTGFFWKERATPLASAVPEAGPPPASLLRPSDTRPPAAMGMEEDEEEEEEEDMVVGGGGLLAGLGTRAGVALDAGGGGAGRGRGGGGGGLGLGLVVMEAGEDPGMPRPWVRPEEPPHRDPEATQVQNERQKVTPWHPNPPSARHYPENRGEEEGVPPQVVVEVEEEEDLEPPEPTKPPTPDPLQVMGDLHRRTHLLQNHDRTSYFVRTKAGALCFRQGTEVAPPSGSQANNNNKAPANNPSTAAGAGAGAGAAAAGNHGQRQLLQQPMLQQQQLQPQQLQQQLQQQQQQQPQQLQQRPDVQQQAQVAAAAAGGGAAAPHSGKPRRGKRLVKCVCRPGWHGPYCGVPTMVYHSNLPTKERLTPRETPRRVINAINVNHEFDLLHVRFHELADAVDLFLVCESNFTAYGDRRTMRFLRLLLNGTYDYIRHKILYVFLNHFPDGGRQDGWIADDYLRTFLTRNGMSRVIGLRPDDVFIINDADEIPAREGVLFLKLFDGWTEPFAIHMRKSLYGFFWKQLGSLEVVSGCTVGMLRDVYDDDGIRLRRREYYTMPGFRKYENDTGHILVQWSLGSPFHFAGWHCSWCFTPEGIHLKLVSAQNGDFPRWGDYEDKRDLRYIRELIRTGGWFDGSMQEYPPSDPKEHMYAPKYMLDHYDRYRYLLENPYATSPSGG
ncbi:beta-1,4-mannosyl-glycoprotein 4-beta-N-acetylglucosaminyltransferase isoform X2 [Engraulis encrasicolus]